MQKLIPSYYAEYGREIDRSRAIPLNIDGLKLVERRVLWVLSKINKKTKSINAIGEAIKIHPHGDVALYEVLDKQVFQHRAIGFGIWSSLGKDGMAKPAAARYTEIKINNKTCGSAFKYINDVPYDNFDLANEPLYFADIIPLGLCGRNDITGIGFHRTIIPRYDKKDLAKRLKWLLTDNNQNIKFDDTVRDPSIFGPLIKPQYNDCVSTETTKYTYYELLMCGQGVLKIIPYGKPEKKNIIHIQGKQSSSSFNSLLKYCTNNKISVIENNQENDPYFLDLELKFPKRALVNNNINDTCKYIWKTFLIKSVYYKCYFVDFETKNVQINSIDQVLLNNYKYYKKIVFNNYLKKFNKLNDEYFYNHIILIIKDILNTYDIKDIDEILNKYDKTQEIKLEQFDIENNTYIDYYRKVIDDDINYVINKYSIKKLINIQIDLNNIIDNLNQYKINIQNIDSDCFNLIDSYL